jgi:hypothetical protein
MRPIDLDRDAACPYCGVAVALLDGNAVREAIRSGSRLGAVGAHGRVTAGIDLLRARVDVLAAALGSLHGFDRRIAATPRPSLANGVTARVVSRRVNDRAKE